MCFHPNISCFFFLPKVSQWILNMQCHGEKITVNMYLQGYQHIHILCKEERRFC